MKNNPIIGCMRWGVWGANFNTKQYETIINQCVEVGLNTFDHADIYGNYTTEADFGKVLYGNNSLRESIKLITKCGIQMVTPNRPLHTIKSYNTSTAHITRSVEQSLQNFKTDYIDTLLIHRPDILLDTDEIAEVITKLKDEGKIKNFGVSNFTVSQVELLSSKLQIECHQLEISLTNLSAFEDGILDQCHIKGIEVQSWSPLGADLFIETSDRNSRILKQATALAEIYKTGINQVLLAFLYRHPSGITPVIGSTKFDRIVQAKEAVQILLNREDFYKLWIASTGSDIA
jgi:predicted oxidoreductase